MAEQKIAAVIESLNDFETKLPGFLNASKTLAVLLDYDGTLAPIANNPNSTAMPVELESILKKLAKNPNIFIAIISGRALKDVQTRVGINGITYAGNHGLEIEYPDLSRHDYELPESVQKAFKNLVVELNEKVHKNNAWVENKHVTLTYHYRDTPVNIKDQLKENATEIIKRHGFQANQAHEAIEAKPPVNWNKGEAARYILKNKFGEDWTNQIKVVFAGDDSTDEDAMRILKGIGKSFRIASNKEIRTFADFRLPHQDLVTDLLKWIASVYVIN